MSNRVRVVTVALVLAVATAAQAQVPDLSAWEGAWFKVRIQERGMGFQFAGPEREKDGPDENAGWSGSIFPLDGSLHWA